MNAMNAGFTTHDAMHRWTLALDCARHVIEGTRFDDPDEARRLADSSAALHGLLSWIRESCPATEPESARLDWNIQLLADAATALYRDLGMSEEATLERIARLSGAMTGTARQMNGGAVEIWGSLSRAAEKRESVRP